LLPGAERLQHHLDERDNAPIDIGQIALACALGYFAVRLPDDPWRDGCRRLANRQLSVTGVVACNCRSVGQLAWRTRANARCRRGARSSIVDRRLRAIATATARPIIAQIVDTTAGCSQLIATSCHQFVTRTMGRDRGFDRGQDRDALAIPNSETTFG
jgi:hypothetical protein